MGGGWLQEHLSEVVVADVRWYLDGRCGRTAYAAGHIPTAVFLDLDLDLSAPPSRAGGRHPLPEPEDFAAALSAAGIGDGCPVVAYDDCSGMVAGRLWWMLRTLGCPAALLDGGMAAWPGPLSTEAPSPQPAHFTPRRWPADRYATIAEVDSLRHDRSAVVFDARSAERYRGEPNAVDPRFGHIPGARSVPFAANLGPDGALRSPAELQELYAAAGVTEDTAVVASCGSGVSACLGLLALEVAGRRDARLFVGSWSAWGSDESRPLAAGDEPG